MNECVDGGNGPLRDGLLPEWFARVHPILGTPANATAFTGITTGLLALCVDIDILAELVSIGTLAIFGSVCAGLLARRYTPEDGSGRGPAMRRVAALAAACVAFSVSYHFVDGGGGGGGGDSGGEGGNGSGEVGAGVSTTDAKSGGGGGGGGGGGLVATAACVTSLGCIFAATVSFNRLPRHNYPKNGFATPLVPYLPAVGVLACVQLITSLGPLAWGRFFVYSALCSVGYFGYGVAGIMRGWGPASLHERLDEDKDEAGTELLVAGGSFIDLNGNGDIIQASSSGECGTRSGGDSRGGGGVSGGGGNDGGASK